MIEMRGRSLCVLTGWAKKMQGHYDHKGGTTITTWNPKNTSCAL